MAARLDWRGRQVLEQARRATAAGITDTLQAAVDDAKSNHWWSSRSGQLQSEVVMEAARSGPGMKISGRFGTTKTRGFYGLILERRMPFLRPAADRTFPTLARRIARRMR